MGEWYEDQDYRDLQVGDTVIGCGDAETKEIALENEERGKVIAIDIADMSVLVQWDNGEEQWTWLDTLYKVEGAG